MAFTAVYVLVDHGRGVYASMVEVSVRALRRVQPGVPVALDCDEQSVPYLTGSRGRLLAHLDRLVPVPADHPDLAARGLGLKPHVRDLVAGDLLFIDGDTLPVRPLGDVFDRAGWDVAMVQDRNHHCPIDPAPPHWLLPRLRRAGLDRPPDRYFNTGVMYLRDNPAVRALAARWQARLRELHAVGEHCDQFALNCVLPTDPVRVLELPPAYNAMVAAHPAHARGAKVYHFYAGTNAANQDSLFAHLLRHLDATGELDAAAIDRCLELDHPWLPPYWPRRLWQTGNRLLAARLFARNLFGKVLGRPAAGGRP